MMRADCASEPPRLHVMHRADGHEWLVWPVYSVKGAWLYQLALTRLDDAERHLDGGRFRYYCAAPQANRIMLRRHLATEQQLQAHFVALFAWLDRHVRAPAWSLAIHALHVHDMEIAVSFAAAVPAVYFALTWLGAGPLGPDRRTEPATGSPFSPSDAGQPG